MGDVSLLEWNELNQYVRHDLSVYVSWFTFFLTLLLGAMAWSLKASTNARGIVATPFPFFCMVALFSVQIVFAIMATTSIADDFIRADDRIGVLVEHMNQCANCKLAGTVFTSPFPKSLHVAMNLMKWTLVTNLCFWLIVAVYVYVRQGKRLLGNNL